MQNIATNISILLHETQIFRICDSLGTHTLHMLHAYRLGGALCLEVKAYKCICIWDGKIAGCREVSASRVGPL